MELRDERNCGHPVNAAFLGELTGEQKTAAKALLAHETGVLGYTVARPGIRSGS